ncbi:MAG TPA: alpha/beta hydrolase [Verrucomicrobiae bacterium]|nr:alpha/beta hydrolase [Verrucomicrobiae bacterium]
MKELHYRSLPEETLRIPLPNTDNLHIKGVLRGSLDGPVVVMMHGRPGYGNEMLQYLAAHYLHEEGFTTLRLWMYDWEPGTRNLLDCTLDTHVSDFDTVVAYLRARGAREVFAEGHSYGGITILKSQAKINGAVLWDPTHSGYWLERPDGDPEFPERLIGEYSIGLVGAGSVVARKASDYDRALEDTTQWAAHKGYPLEIITAGKGVMVHLAKQYIEVADSPKRHIIIPDARHQLNDSDEVVFTVLQETAEWLKEIQRG